MFWVYKDVQTLAYQKEGCEEERFGTMGITNFQKIIHVSQYSKRV